MIQENRFSKSVLFFMKFMVQDKKILFFILLLNFAAMIFNIIEPLLAKRIVDISFSLRNLEELIIPAGIWGSIYLIRYFVLYLSRKYSLNYNLNVYRKIRLFLFSNILKKRVSFFQENGILSCTIILLLEFWIATFKIFIFFLKNQKNIFFPYCSEKAIRRTCRNLLQ